MINRTAETLFWIGRYIERAENNARRINVNYHMRHVLGNHENELRWEKLIASLGDIGLFKNHFEKADESTTLRFLVFDQYNQNSLYSSIRSTRTNVRNLRQILPSEMWNSINSFYLWLDNQNMQKLLAPSPYSFYQNFQDWVGRFNGTAYSTMVRDNVWNFIQAGRFFERAENILRVLHSCCLNYSTKDLHETTSENYNHLILLLKSASGYEAFRKLYADNVTFENVLEFLILHPKFPRSVQYSLTRLESYLTEIKEQDYQFHVLAETANEFVSKMKDHIANAPNDLFLEHSFIQAMFKSINNLGAEIENTFFQEEFISL